LRIKEKLEMKRTLIAALLLVAPLMAQTDPAKPQRPEQVQKLVTLKYVDPQSIQNLIGMFNVDIRVNGQMKVVALSGTKEHMAAAEEAIKQLDVPSAAQKNIELTIYFVAGTDQANGSGNPIPQDLQSTVAQLKNTFPFKNYGLLDVLSIRTRSGVGAETVGQLGPRITVFKVRSASLDGDGSTIRLDGLHAGLRNPMTDGAGKTTYIDSGISADVLDVKEGQRLVIGRSSMDGPEKALFLVLIAKVVN
jgi:hypothetical protein